jgi:hypothetical protein
MRCTRRRTVDRTQTTDGPLMAIPHILARETQVIGDLLE